MHTHPHEQTGYLVSGRILLRAGRREARAWAGRLLAGALQPAAPGHGAGALRHASISSPRRGRSTASGATSCCRRRRCERSSWSTWRRRTPTIPAASWRPTAARTPCSRTSPAGVRYVGGEQIVGNYRHLWDGFPGLRRRDHPLDVRRGLRRHRADALRQARGELPGHTGQRPRIQPAGHRPLPVRRGGPHPAGDRLLRRADVHAPAGHRARALKANADRYARLSTLTPHTANTCRN